MRKEYHQILLCSIFWSALVAWDEEEGERCQEARCPFCGGKLDRAYYERKVRGLLFALGRQARRRVSFCCRECRRRVTPPSVRFVRHKVFSFLNILLALSLLETGATGRVASATARTSEVSLRRWRVWRAKVQASNTWKQLRAKLSALFCESRFPASLFEEFSLGGASLRTAVVTTVKFLSPFSVLQVT